MQHKGEQAAALSQPAVRLGGPITDEAVRNFINHFLKCLPGGSGTDISGTNGAPKRKVQFEEEAPPTPTSRHRDLFGEDYDPGADEPMERQFAAESLKDRLMNFTRRSIASPWKRPRRRMIMILRAKALTLRMTKTVRGFF